MVIKRKTHFVDRSLQGAILVHLVMQYALFLLAAGTILYFVELLASAPRDAGKNMVSRYGPTVLAVLVLAPIFLRDLCKLTNRFAGPMVRLRRAMRELAEGREVPPIHFREHDFWKDLAVDFNRVIERVHAAERPMKDDDLERHVTSHPEGAEHA
jgi:hypothetical protein